MSRSRWSNWDVVLEGCGYEIQRRWKAGDGPGLPVGRAQVRIVINGRPLVQAEGNEDENGRIMHLLMGVLGRDGVKEALLAGPDVPEEAEA